ncbi:hypothetical protein AVEN_51855-1 [Araneus ventricosus]|uniref:Uncharacterized protein n=1 Tax=Araneus ventricosus TaxID=182803 RepID=A0A4Y2IWH8_ARAVE|nr:hypothetical protein AVEN_51855-1 [Araneus ventricosus]
MCARGAKIRADTHTHHSSVLAPSDFNLFGLLKKHLAGRHFRTNAESQEAVVKWTLISSMPVSMDCLTDATNDSTTMVTMWKSNKYECLSAFVYLFDFLNKSFLSEDL